MSQESVSLHTARASDLPDIVAMRNTLNAHELAGCSHAPIQKLSLEQFTTLWGPTLEDPDYCWRIVAAEGRPIGFGLIYLLKPKTDPPGAFVHWAYIEARFRGQGVGQLLMDQLFDWARSRKVQRVELQYIDGNDLAEHFWTKLGFRTYARKCVLKLSSGD